MSDISVEYVDHKLAYYAGFLDGEGCFLLGNSLTVKCAHTYLPILDELKERFGGNIRKRPKQPDRKQVWVWSIHSKTAADCLSKLFPFLREKKRQVKYALEYQSTILPRGSKVPKETRERRKQLRKEFKQCRV